MLIKLYGLSCDGCGSRGAAGFATVKLARAYVRSIGWKRTPAGHDQPAEDRCPRCIRRAVQ